MKEVSTYNKLVKFSVPFILLTGIFAKKYGLNSLLSKMFGKNITIFLVDETNENNENDRDNSTDNNDSTKCIEYTLSDKLETIRREHLLRIFKKLKDKEKSHFSIVNLSANSDPYLSCKQKTRIYLIHNNELTSSIKQNARNVSLESNGTLNNLFQSHLIEPYLIFDSECQHKLTLYEYETIIVPLINNHFETLRSHFIDTIFPHEFKLFMQNNSKEDNNDNKFRIEVESLLFFIYRTTTVYLKTLFKFKSTKSNNTDIIFDEKDQTSFQLLSQIFQMTTLSLFTKDSYDLVLNYSQTYQQWLTLISHIFNIEEETDENDDFKINNYGSIKFILIKNMYLEIIQVYSSLTWILNDTIDSSYGLPIKSSYLNNSKNDLLKKVDLIKDLKSSKTRNIFLSSKNNRLTSLKELVKVYANNSITSDLYYLNSANLVKKSNLVTGKRMLKSYQLILQDFHLNKNDHVLIAMNSNGSYSELNSFSKIILECLVFSCLKAYRFINFKTKTIPLYDLALSNMPEIDYYQVELLTKQQ
jgi:hypothetical protein